MKSTFRTMTIVACFALVSLTSCYFPEEQAVRLHSFARPLLPAYITEESDAYDERDRYADAHRQ